MAIPVPGHARGVSRAERLTIADVASVLGFARHTVSRLRTRGELPPPVEASANIVRWRSADVKKCLLHEPDVDRVAGPCCRRRSEMSAHDMHAAFVRAVCENTDDNTPRLVYADWLEENGDPAHAEVIRLQCRLDNTSDWDADAEETCCRIDDLLSVHAGRWLRPLGLSLDNAEFSRGFVYSVKVTAAHFLESAEVLHRSAPLREVTLSQVTGLVGDIARLPVLGKVRSLHLICNDIEPEEAQALFASPYLQRLEHLFMPFSAIGDTGAVALAGSPSLRRLRVLDLSLSGIRRRGAVALAGSRYLRALEFLGLVENRIGPAGAMALASAPTWPIPRSR